MNLSGSAVQACARYYRLQPEQIMVVHDEIDFPFGRVRLKFSGGTGGHNGVNDIVRALASRDFWRLRIGVGRPANKAEVKNYVLSNFSLGERQILDVVIENLLPGLEHLCTGAMQRGAQQIAQAAP